MKTYIDFPVVIQQHQDISNEEWGYLCDKFREFEEKFVIFNKIEDDIITIQPQKIVLGEPCMAEFLEVMEEYKSFSNIEDFKYQAETNRIIVSIITKGSTHVPVD